MDLCAVRCHYFPFDVLPFHQTFHIVAMGNFKSLFSSQLVFSRLLEVQYLFVLQGWLVFPCTSSCVQSENSFYVSCPCFLIKFFNIKSHDATGMDVKCHHNQKAICLILCCAVAEDGNISIRGA